MTDLHSIDEVIARGPYTDTWESLCTYTVPEWYRNAKFGIFIHWGVYSVPAFGNEWYPRNMYIQGTPEYEHHIKTYGAHRDFGYKDFVPMFTAEKFDADEWAQLFKRAGARYVVPVAEHHDGFQMYRSDISHWNAYEMGPHRDVLGELEESFEKNGLVTGCSSHRIEHWFFMGHGRDFDSDIKGDLKRGDLYWPAMPVDDMQGLKSPVSEEYMEDWLLRTCELVDRYRPAIVYFDWWIHVEAAKPYLRKFAAYYYNRAHEWGREVVINYKHDAYVFGSAVPDVERGQFGEMKPYFWQSDTAVALNSWGYTKNNRYKDPRDIVCDLLDIVSKNGCLLLNVGPASDGTIPEEDKNVLLGIGKWMEKNGEAIYGTRPYRVYGEGPTEVTDGQFSDGIKKCFTSRDFRFTRANGCLYAAAMAEAPDGVYEITTLGERDASRQANFHGLIGSVTCLETGEEVKWERTGSALKLYCGAKTNGMPLVFKIRLG